MRRVLLAVVTLAAFFIPPAPAHSQDDPPGVIGGPLQVDPAAAAAGGAIDPARVEAAQERLEEIRARLALTDEQQAAAEPIFRTSFERRAALLQDIRADGGQPTFRELRTLRGQLDAIDAETDAELAPILAPEQLAELDAIQEELRAEVRERFQQTRASRATP